MCDAPVVEGFDPELHLRLLGERMLVDRRERDSGWGASPLEEATAALLAVAAVDQAVVESVNREYDLALILRGEDEWRYHHRARRAGRPASASATTAPVRLAECSARIEHASGTLELDHVMLTPDRTTLAVTLRTESPYAGRVGRSGHAIMAQMHGAGGLGPLQGLRIEDDRGGTAQASFSGGGSEGHWEGHLHLEPPLAADTAWISVDGTQVELRDSPRLAETRVEPAEPTGDAAAYLWRRLAQRSEFHGPPDLEPAITALTAAGALEPQDPVCGELRAVASRLGDGGYRPVVAQGPTELPEPWKSLFARHGRSDGPLGSILVNATTPPFDGIALCLLQLSSDQESFTVDAEIAGEVGPLMPFDSVLDGSGLTWWADDDRGNSYLGAMEGSSGSDALLQGEVGFFPALDPEAGELEVTITASTTRAVISFPLTWRSES